VSFEFVLHRSLRAPTSRARLRPAIKGLYSAWLLDVLKLKRRDCSIRTLSSPSSITPAPAPGGFEEPSTCMVHQVCWGVCSCRSLAKSARHCALMGPYGS